VLEHPHPTSAEQEAMWEKQFPHRSLGSVRHQVGHIRRALGILADRPGVSHQVREVVAEMTRGGSLDTGADEATGQ
jgi:DNA-binding SARP family transcriptional activator